MFYSVSAAEVIPSVNMVGYIMVLWLVVLLGLCGGAATRSAFIIGGAEVKVGEFPWQAALKLFGQFTCGGALISVDYVITAAHCTGNAVSYYTLVLGLHDLEEKRGKPTTFRLTAIIQHPMFEPTSRHHDVALVKLAPSASLDKNHIWTVKMAPNDNYDYTLSVLCSFSGWGQRSAGGNLANELQGAAVNVMLNTECKLFWGSQISDTDVCVTDKESQQTSACNGDSGNPLVCIRDGRWHLVGVTSLFSPSCDPAFPSVFARMSYFRDWVKKVTGV